jgi:uncharacterized membrane protein YbhN (UPF0104 family)
VLALAVSGCLVANLAGKLDGAELLRSLRALPAAGLGAALTIYAGLGVLRALRFRLLLDQPGLALRVLVPISLLHNMLVRTLPWLAGEVSYPALVRRHLGLSVSAGLTSLAGARMVELLFVLAGGLLGLLSLDRRLPGRKGLLLAYGTALLLALIGVLLLAPCLRSLGAFLATMGARRRPRLVQAGNWATRLAQRTAELWRPRLLAGNVLWSALTYSTGLSFQLLLLRLAGVEAPLGLQVAAVSLVTLVSVIPLAVGGLGIVEGGWTFGLTALMGLPLRRAVALAFLLHGAQLLCALLTGIAGWAWLALAGRHR